VDYRFGLYGYDYFFVPLILTYPFRALMSRSAAALLRELGLLGIVSRSALRDRSLASAHRQVSTSRHAPFLVIIEALMLFSIVRRQNEPTQPAVGGDPRRFLAISRVCDDCVGLYRLTDVF